MESGHAEDCECRSFATVESPNCSKFHTQLGQADPQVHRSVQSEGLSQLVLQHSGQVAFRGQVASAMDARLGHLLVLVCWVNLTQTVIITIKFSKRKQAKANLKVFL